MTATVNIARCPEHGLHGCRPYCFVCGKPAEQEAMVPAAAVEPLLTALRTIAERRPAQGEAGHTFLQRAANEAERDARAAIEAHEAALATVPYPVDEAG